MDRRDYLKPSRFGNTEKRRLLDTKNLKEKRSIRRTTNFNLRRDINGIVQELNKNVNENVPPKVDKVIDRKLALQKFRAEREAQKKTLKNQKKPPFIVGIPHHGSSPLLRDLNAEKKVTKASTTHEVRSKRVTRATTRILQGNVLKEKPKVNEQPRNVHVFKAPPSVRVFPFKDNKTMFTFQPYKIPQSEKKLTSPHTPTVLKRSVQKKPLKSVSNLVKKLKKSPERPNSLEADELLAAPLTEAVDETAAVGGTPDPIKPELLENACITGTSDLVKADQIKEEGTENNGEDSDRQDPFNMSHLKTNLRRNPKRSHKKDAIENLPAPTPNAKEKSEEEGQEVTVVGEAQIKDETLENVNSLLTKESEIERKDDEGNINKDEDNELADQVAFQLGRLQTETTRLVGLADQWEVVGQRESLPQEVTDEVDSLVGQTRLLTSDKFRQFHGIVVQYQQQTGIHPVTLDDLNGFWDMVYLQVESLDKKYAALDALRNNNWVKPEPASRKKRRPVKMLKVNKVTQIEKSSISEKQKIHLQAPEDQQINTSMTNMKPVISSGLFKTNRTRSNSPSPYIAMRLSGIGRTSNIMVQLPATDGTPRSKLVLAETPGTPKSALKKSWTKLLTESAKERRSTSTMSSAEVKIEEAVEDTERLTAAEDYLVPAATPRRSMRLMTKLQTPASCSACETASCERSQCMISNRSTQKSSQRQSRRQAVSPVEELLEATTKPDCTKDNASKGTRNSKKILKFSPSESQQKSDTVAVTELTQPRETDLNKPSTSGARFSLRPSILNVSEVPKKALKRRQASVNTASTTPEEQDAEGLGAKSQRSTRQSRKVTFESEVGEKRRFKLPATPYRKSQADS